MKTIRIANSKIELINTWINTFSKTYGLSFTSSKYICKTLGYKKKTILKFNSKLIIKQFSELELLIKNFEYKFENNLKNRKNWNLKKLRDLACYRGHRNTFGLPNRGQRTCSNGKTKALFFRTVTSKRKKWNTSALIKPPLEVGPSNRVAYNKNLKSFFIIKTGPFIL